MTKQKFSERVDFTYFMGAGISFLLLIISLFFYRESGLPLIFSLVSSFTYIGVLFRGLIDRNSWGKTQRQMKISAFVGFTSIFVIFGIESVLLLTRSFELSKNEVKTIFIYGGVGIVILYIFLYTVWFKKMVYRQPGESQIN